MPYFLLLPIAFFPPLLRKCSFQALPSTLTSSPNNSNNPFFDASFTVLFSNALSISFTATPSNLHHQLLSGVSPFLPPPPLVMSWFLFPLLLDSFYFYPCSKARPLTSSLLFQPCCFWCYVPPISPHTLFHHFHFPIPFLLHSAPLPHLFHPAATPRTLSHMCLHFLPPLPFSPSVIPWGEWLSANAQVSLMGSFLTSGQHQWGYTSFSKSHAYHCNRALISTSYAIHAPKCTHTYALADRMCHHQGTRQIPFCFLSTLLQWIYLQINT